MTRRLHGLSATLRSIDPDAVGFLLGRMALYDIATHTHMLTVAEVTRRFAIHLGYNVQQVEEISHAALFHDIGKLNLSIDILQATRSLTQAEWVEVQKHPGAGAWMLHEAGERKIANIVHSHHERIDGSGYPHALKGDQIPVASQIISVVDSYDTMLYERPYKPPLPHIEVIDRLSLDAGKTYDRELVNEFIRLMNHDNESRLAKLRT